MLRKLLLLQCLSLLALSVSSLPVDDPAKTAGAPVKTVEVTPTEDKLPKAGASEHNAPKTEDIGDLDDLDKIIPDTVPDDLPEFEETAKNPADTVDTADKLPETGDSTDLDDQIQVDPIPDHLPEFEETDKNPGDTVDTIEITPTEDKLPETGDSDDNAPKTGESTGLADLDKIIPDLPNLPKLPDLIPGCKKDNESCSGFPACCGDLKCYWESGLSFAKEGVCVPCVAEGLSCYRSGQCCGNNDDDDEAPDAIICDKGTNPFEDGTCGPKRTSGNCYKNKQCKGHNCDKKWYRLTGSCKEAGE